MNDFETIIATALIGTERQALPPLTLEPNLNAPSKEAALLTAAALVTQYRKAARVSAVSAATLEPSGADNKPELPANLRNLLERVLNGHQELLSEFLELTSRYRFAHRDLPRMLELGRGNTSLRAGLLNGLDTRGRWLAGLEKSWAWATGSTETIDDAVKSFETGSKAARVLALQAVREADPDAARALLETTWKQDPAPERKEFIAVLGTKLSPADEPFLETALHTDRSVDVRDTAADLLAQIPTSAFNARLLEWLRPILRVTTPKSAGLLGGIKDKLGELSGKNSSIIDIELPEAFDPAWAKDGIVEKAPQATGQKQWWVQQMMRRTSLEMLQTITGLDALTLLKNTHKDWKDFIKQAVQVTLQRNPTRELVKQLIAYDFTLVRHNPAALGVLEPNTLETLTKQRCLVDGNSDLALLEACRHPWSESFWVAAVEWVAQQAARRRSKQNNSSYFHGFGAVLLRSTPLEKSAWLQRGHATLPHWTTLIQTIDEPLPEDAKNQWYWNYAQQEVNSLIKKLEIRLELHRLVKPPAMKEHP